MSRTTRAELDELAAMINRRLDLRGSEVGYFVEAGNGGHRLYRDGGSREVSPRLPAGALADWMRAFLAGIEAEEEAYPRPAEGDMDSGIHIYPEPLPNTGAGSQVEAYRG